MRRVFLALGVVTLIGSLLYFVGGQAEANESGAVASPHAKIETAVPAAPDPALDAQAPAPDAQPTTFMATASRSGLLLLCIVLMTVALLVMHRRHPQRVGVPGADS